MPGGSQRNFDSYGHRIAELASTQRDLLCDPQTSGGLLVSCAPGAVDAVLATFARHGFDAAAVVGRVTARGAQALRVV